MACRNVLVDKVGHVENWVPLKKLQLFAVDLTHSNQQQVESASGLHHPPWQLLILCTMTGIEIWLVGDC